MKRKNSIEIEAFGVHLRKIREERGLSQQQLADDADIARKTVERIENAKFSVTIDVLVSLARGLHMSLSQLMDFK